MKWTIVFTFPSGSKFVASHSNGMFGMVPIIKGSCKGAFGFDTRDEAVEWFKSFLKSIGPEESAKFKPLKPRPMQCQIDSGAKVIDFPGPKKLLFES